MGRGVSCEGIWDWVRLCFMMIMCVWYGMSLSLFTADGYAATKWIVA